MLAGFTRTQWEKLFVSLALLFDFAILGVAIADASEGNPQRTQDAIDIPVTTFFLGLALSLQKWSEPEIPRFKKVATAALPFLGVAGSASLAFEKVEGKSSQPVTACILSAATICFALSEFPLKRASEEQMKIGKRIEQVESALTIVVAGVFILITVAEMGIKSASPQRERFYLQDEIAEVPIELTLLALQSFINIWRKSHTSPWQRGLSAVMLISLLGAVGTGTATVAIALSPVISNCLVAVATICFDALTWPAREGEDAMHFTALA